jgi:RNA recognition motif-containing protein
MILEAVGKFGSVTALNLVIPPTSPQTPSFCFVSFHDPQSAQFCIAELNGRIVLIV